MKILCYVETLIFGVWRILSTRIFSWNQSITSLDTIYQKISNALTKLVDNESRSRTLRRYLRKVYNYFTSKDAKLEFLLKYKDVEREKRFEHASEALNEEANITSIELVGNRLAENSRKRNFEVSFIKIIIPVYV